MSETARILSLPTWDPEAVKDVYTAQLRTPQGQWDLHPEQVQTLHAIQNESGALPMLGVGGGKSLIAYLAPVLMKSKRPVMLLPKQLFEEMDREAEIYAEHWKIADLLFLSYERYSRNAGILDGLDPDMLICDEAHALKSPSTARGRDFTRWCKAHPEVIKVFMSATHTRDSVLDYWHLSKAALGLGSPLPVGRQTIEAWSRVIDVRPQMSASTSDYYQLQALIDSGWGDTYRTAFRGRLRATPGIIISDTPSCDLPLSIIADKAPLPLPLLEAHQSIEAYITPCGRDINSPLDVHRMLGQITQGGYLRWIYMPEWDWLNARGNWHKASASFCAKSTRFVTEARLRRGILDEVSGLPRYVLDAYSDWEPHMDTPAPPTEWIWIDDSPLHRVIGMMPDRGIVWYKHPDVGRRLEELGLSVAYRQQPPTRQDRMGLSTLVHSKGVNLQQWQWNYVLQPPANGPMWEQMIGRTHRYGQKGSVEVHVAQTTWVQKNALTKALADAKYKIESTGMPDRLVNADFT